MPLPAPSQLSISQVALRRIRASVIQDINENSNEAANCRSFYPLIVAKALEGPHNWSFAAKRVQLALASTNDRTEWLYAYVMPADCASPMRVLPDFSATGLNLPAPYPCEPYSEAWLVLKNFSTTYEIESGKLYTNAENAWLDYTINDITGTPETNLFADAVAYELAAELAISVKGDANLKKDMVAQAELAWQRAVAADENRQPQTYGDYESESILARHAGAPFRNWDYW